jgi:2-polyprenyl-6-methoxyphenol hydroxylase-like FAD-dependent oxidoreductase
MWIFFRLIPIEHEQEKDYEPHYEASLSISYPANLDDVDLKVDDISLIGYVKRMIRKLRPECELTDIFLEMWDLASGVNPKFPFKTYNHVQRRKLRDIDPLSVNVWESSRVTLLGDAVHAMNPILGLGANSAFKDAEILSQALLNYSPENYISCIKGYENEMIKRSSAAVLKGRSAALKQASPVGGYFGLMFRNYSLKIVNFLMNVFGRDIFFTR